MENVSSATGKKAQRQHEFTVEKPDLTRTLFPNLCKIAQISLSIPVTTASVERSFSQMKLIKTRLCSSLTDKNLSNLMKIAIEAPDT